MSLVALPVPADRHPSPSHLPTADSQILNLGTNNPFRRASSPGKPSISPVRTVSPPLPELERSMSRNPFIDPPTGAALLPKPHHDAATTKLVDDIFRDNTSPDRSRHLEPSQRNAPRHPSVPSNGHRTVRSGDAKDGSSRPHPDASRRLAHSPEKHRPRRNSDSSIMDREKAEEDRRRRERRRERREREAAKDAKDGKDGKDKDGKSRSKPARRPQGFDVIDKLDLTGIYSHGLIHHDGPFDACNPHRNKKANGRAPMQAFHPNSANNALGGNMAPRAFDYDSFHGRGAEGFADYASAPTDYTISPEKPLPKHYQDKVAVYINPTDRVQQIHGEESTGLGTSTFLEGAPASRSAVRRESENDMQPMAGPGLGRKKSLAMRIRGISQPRAPPPRIAGSPDRFGPHSPETPPPVIRSAGGLEHANPIATERNPFFETGDKKAPRIQIAESAQMGGRSVSYNNSSRAGPALTRSITADSADRKESSSGGLLSRMKSLKGGRRPRPEVRT